MVDAKFYNNNGPFSLGKIAEICEAELTDSEKSAVEVSNIETMDHAKEGDICFFYDRKLKDKAAEIKATACITTLEFVSLIPSDVITLVASNPHLAFLKLNEALYNEPKPRANVSNSARIAKDVIFGENCFIGENVVLEEGVKIGDNCIIDHNCVIARGCQIGNNCHISTHVRISHCIMGDNCFILSGARIGDDGFGFIMVNGRHKRLPQVGRVIIGNDVEVGANSCVDRGALDDTVIGDGCRIDNLVQVAHNVKLGRGCILVAQTGIAGSCTFGDYVVCGGQTGFADHLNIGSGAQIAAQSGIMRNVEPGAVIMGTPAVPIKDFMRQVSFLQKSSKK